MLVDFDMTDLWKDDFPIFNCHGRVPFAFLNLRIGEAIVSIISLEAWEAWGFALFAPSKEILECFVYSVQGILQDLRIDLFILRTKLFDLGQLSRLILERD